jgi:hypothetical protein
MVWSNDLWQGSFLLATANTTIALLMDMCAVMPSWFQIIVTSINALRGFLGLRKLMRIGRQKNSTPRRYLRLRSWRIGSFEHYSVTIREVGFPPSKRYLSARQRGIAGVSAELTSVIPKLVPLSAQLGDSSQPVDEKASVTNKTSG